MTDMDTPEQGSPEPPPMPTDNGYQIPPPGNRPPRTYNRPPKKKSSSTGMIVTLVVAVVVIGFIALVGLAGVGAAFSGASGMGHYQEYVVEKGASSQKVVIIPIYGIISSGRSLFGGFAGVDSIREKLRMALEDDDVVAVILDINSPGGEVTATDELHYEVQKLRDEGKLVVTCMRSVAASGGYYMAAGTDYIIANRLTMTGSIGVVIGGMNYSKLMEKIGVEGNTFKSGRMKDMGSPARHTLEEIARARLELRKRRLSVQDTGASAEIKAIEMKQIDEQLADLDKEEAVVKQEQALIQGMVDECFNEFAKIVSEGRKLPLETVKSAPIGDARILSGTEALKLKLVDQLGFMDDAIEYARQGEDLKVVRYDPIPTLFDAFGGRAQSTDLVKEIVPEHLRIIKQGRLYYMNPNLF